MVTTKGDGEIHDFLIELKKGEETTGSQTIPKMMIIISSLSANYLVFTIHTVTSPQTILYCNELRCNFVHFRPKMIHSD